MEVATVEFPFDRISVSNKKEVVKLKVFKILNRKDESKTCKTYFM